MGTVKRQKLLDISDSIGFFKGNAFRTSDEFSYETFKELNHTSY